MSSGRNARLSLSGLQRHDETTPDRITDYKAPTAEEASNAKKAAKRPPIVNYPGKGSGK